MKHLKDVENQQNIGVLAQYNFEAIEGRLWRCTPSVQNNEVTTVAGPPTTGEWEVGDLWWDVHLAKWRCTSAGAPGTWIQVTEAIVGEFPEDVPDGYRVTRADQHWRRYAYNETEDDWEEVGGFNGGEIAQRLQINSSGMALLIGSSDYGFTDKVFIEGNMRLWGELHMGDTGNRMAFDDDGSPYFEFNAGIFSSYRAIVQTAGGEGYRAISDNTYGDIWEIGEFPSADQKRLHLMFDDRTFATKFMPFPLNTGATSYTFGQITPTGEVFKVVAHVILVDLYDLTKAGQWTLVGLFYNDAGFNRIGTADVVSQHSNLHGGVSVDLDTDGSVICITGTQASGAETSLLCTVAYEVFPTLV